MLDLSYSLLKNKIKKSSKLSLRKTAFLMFSIRHHVHNFNLQIGNRFEDKFCQPSAAIDLCLDKNIPWNFQENSILDSISVSETSIN